MSHGSSCGQHKITPTRPGNVYLSASHDQEKNKGGKGGRDRDRPSPYLASLIGSATQSSLQEATQMDTGSDVGSTIANISLPPSNSSTDIVSALKIALEGYGCATANDLNVLKLSFDSKLQLQDERIDENTRDVDNKFASLEVQTRSSRRL